MNSQRGEVDDDRIAFVLDEVAERRAQRRRGPELELAADGHDAPNRRRGAPRRRSRQDPSVLTRASVPRSGAESVRRARVGCGRDARQLRSPVRADGRRPNVRPLPARRGRRRSAHASVLVAHPAREPVAPRGRRERRRPTTSARSPTVRAPRPKPGTRELQFMPARVLMQDFTGVPAIVDLAAMRDAMADLGGDPRLDRAGHSRRSRHRPFDRRRCRRCRRRVRAQRAVRVRAQPRALHVLALGAVRVPDAARVPAEPRHLPSGQPRVPRAGRVPRRRWARVSRHARRHRLAHADGERSRRARLGRGWHRGRSRDARSAAVDVVAAGRRHRARRCAAGRVDGDRPRAHGCGVAAQARRGRQVRRVLRRRCRAACRSRTAPRSATCRPSTDRRARSFPSTTRRCATCARPAVPTISSRWSRRTRRSRGSGTTPPSGPSTTRRSRSTSRPIEPSLAGPARPQDRVSLSGAQASFEQALLAFRRQEASVERGPADRRDAHQGRRGVDRVVPGERSARARADARRPNDPPGGGADQAVAARSQALPGDAGRRSQLRSRRRSRGDRRDHVVHEHVEPVGDDRGGTVRAQRGRARAYGSAVGEDVARARVRSSSPTTTSARSCCEPLHELGFDVVGYGCTTCIGNSGPLAPEISEAIDHGDLSVSSVLSGNRNFEGRIHPDCRMNYLASPPLVVAYALAGSIDVDLAHDPLGHDRERCARLPARHLADGGGDLGGRRVGARPRDVRRELRDDPRRRRALEGARRAHRRSLRVGSRVHVHPPADVPRGHHRGRGRRRSDIADARVLALLGDSVTTDHISPAGVIRRGSPAGELVAGARRRSARLQLVRLAARQSRGDGAGHVRQRAPAQPARAGHRGRRHRAPARRRRRRRSTTPRCSTPTKACRWSCSRARSTARARRATGRRRVRRLLGIRGRARRELRAHPPLESGRDGRAAARVPRRCDGRVARADRAARSSASSVWKRWPSPARSRARSP